MASTKLAFTSRPFSEASIPSFIPEDQAEEFEQAIHQKIGERARLLFEESGQAPGNDEANWFRAESEILRSGLQVRESGSWVAINASIPDASGHRIQILVRPKRVIVRARRQAATEGPSVEGTNCDQQDIFLATNLNVEVNASSAVASFRDRNLQLMIRKSRPGTLFGSSEAST
jgi:HSP20 family molecular chaperone IbpA